MVKIELKVKNSNMKSKKRKLKSPQTSERPSKSARPLVSPEVEVVDGTEQVEKMEQGEVSQEFDESCPWRNLELIFLIQNKEFNQQKFVSLTLCFCICVMMEFIGFARKHCKLLFNVLRYFNAGRSMQCSAL